MEFNYFDIMAKAQKGYARLLEPVCRQYNLTRNELDVLLFLYNNPEYDRAVDIVNNRGLSKSHVSLSIGTLEEKALLRRRNDPTDRRSVHLKLTEAALPIVQAGREAQTRFFAYLHRGVDREQMDTVRDFARMVNENIQNLEKII